MNSDFWETVEVLLQLVIVLMTIFLNLDLIGLI